MTEPQTTTKASAQPENVPLDCDKQGPRTELIRSLIEHAKGDFKLAEVTASEDSLWHLADDCRNLYIQLDKYLSSKLEGE